MINEALTYVFKQTIDRVYHPQITSDSAPARPYAVFSTELANVLRDKQEIYAYQYTINLTLVADTAIDLEAIVELSVNDLPEACQHVTLSDSVISILSIECTGESGATYDAESKLWINMITLLVKSDKR